MTTPLKIVACVVGTRPEAIKMAPVVLKLRNVEGLRVRLIATGQHRELLDQALGEFGLACDADLNLMQPGQTLAQVTSRALTALDETFATVRPDLVLAQGDTTTVLAAALAAFYRQIPFGHVEAGLRTGRLDRPFPEEANRLLAGRLSTLHFAPTKGARLNLLREQHTPGSIHLTGNTAIDALGLVTNQAEDGPSPAPTDRFLLVTAHRRESFGEPLREICEAIRQLVDHDPSLSVVFPVHPNPSVQGVVHGILGDVERVSLVAPQGYRAFVRLLKASTLVLTDSGGVQEEAPSLGKPVLVLRDETERPEAVEAGTSLLVGPHRERIVTEVQRLLDDRERYDRIARVINPYGDGLASDRIARVVARTLGLPLPADPGPLFGDVGA